MNHKPMAKKIISFVNQKGGVGKTTLAFNTAKALKKLGKSVLCIDLDPQANLSMLISKKPLSEDRENLFQLLINSQKELRGLHKALLLTDVLEMGDIDLLPGGQDLSGFELTVSGIQFPRPLVLKRFLESSGLIDRYDYIIIDCPPTLGLLVINAICASDGVIIPFKADEFSLQGVKHFYQVLEDVKDMGLGLNPEIITHVPNLLDNRRKTELQSVETIKDFVTGHEKNVAHGFQNRSGILKSINAKKSVFEFESNEYKPIREEFLAMGQKILNWTNGNSSIGEM